MEDLEKMQPRPCKRDFFRASRRKWASTPKLRLTAGSPATETSPGSILAKATLFKDLSSCPLVCREVPMPYMYKTLRAAKSSGAQRSLNTSLVIVTLVLFSTPTDGQNTLASRAGEHPNIWKIAFDRTRVRSSSTFQAILTDIYVMNSDGSQEQKLTHTGLCHRPNWSPDGSQILFM